jgi:hypothetical protein
MTCQMASTRVRVRPTRTTRKTVASNSRETGDAAPWPDKEADPDEAATDWRAVRRRSARTVRRAGRASAPFDSYLTQPGTHRYCNRHLASILDQVFGKPFPCGREANCV